MDFQVKLEGATLSTISEGDLEAQFQERLRELVAVFADPRRYVKTKEGGVRCVIGAEIVLESSSDGAMSVAVSTSLKKPRFNSVWRSLYRRGAAFLVEKDPPKQQPLVMMPPIAVEPEPKPAAACALCGAGPEGPHDAGKHGITSPAAMAEKGAD